MYNRIVAQYIGNYYEHYSKASSVDELKKMVYEKCLPFITNDEAFKRGAKVADWDAIYKALKDSELI